MFLLLLIVGIFLAIGIGVYYYKISTPIITTSQSTSPIFGPSPLTIRLSLSPLPSESEKTAELTATLTSSVDAPNTTARIILPDEITLENGNLTWNGDILAGGIVKFSAVIKVVKKGEWVIKAYASCNSTKCFPLSYDELYVVMCDGIKASHSPPVKSWYEGGPYPIVEVIPGHVTDIEEFRKKMKELVNSSLSLSSLPQLNKEVIVTYTVTPFIDLPNPQFTQLTLAYPSKGFEVTNVEFPSNGEKFISKGQLSWKGSIKSNETIEIKATLKPITTGYGFIYGRLMVIPDGKIITTPISDVKEINVKIGECYATVSEVK
jgi:hypothetical protein